MTDQIIETFNKIASLLSGFTALIDRERRILSAGGNLFFPNVLEKSGGNSELLSGRNVEEFFGCIDGSGQTFTPHCGSREQCAWCGIYQAIQVSMEKGIRVDKEVSFMVNEDSLFRHYDIHVAVAPFNSAEDDLFLLSMEDISEKQRRNLMEKIFYHDVLNTVSSLTMNISLLQESNVSEEVKKYTESLERITDNLTDEIHRQRLISMAESGRLELEKAIINFPEFLTDIVNSFESSREKKGREIILDLPGPKDPGSVAVTDKTLLRRVVSNLIKNALEAVDEGQAVTLSFKRDGDNVVISVYNPGAMTPEVRSRIFHQFFSTKGQNRGLGTYGVKLLVENYLKGKVSFSSTEEKGTFFIVEIPDFRNQPK